MDTITARGYMIEVTWDGRELRAHGTTKAARVALAGEGHAQDVVLPVEAIASAELRPASRLTNGNLIVITIEGRKYQMHFRRKQAEEFQDLHAQMLPFIRPRGAALS